jgi:hypothetical protein
MASDEDVGNMATACPFEGSTVPRRKGLEVTVPFSFAVARNLSKSFQFLEVAHRQGSVSSQDEIRDPTVELLTFTHDPFPRAAFVVDNYVQPGSQSAAQRFRIFLANTNGDRLVSIGQKLAIIEVNVEGSQSAHAVQ